MYLKKLELIGFKSFATQTEFEFVPGITVIVGPNGSGKSNVTDGIRWVLGEQSIRTLRGAKMEDVIFAGSESRKPIGYCEVTITFGNESRRLPLDYSEVTVTRRVYRSGESEYYLNKQACRLKDIHELFMDTGIGRDTYSMIGQGRIDEILSNKSDERRAIFEDAAGIVKYKSRKKEAEKKLEGTSQNLVRIHDLIYQLEDQIEPLIEKVEIAHEYTSLQGELQELEIGLYIHKIEDLHQKWQESCEIVKELEEANTLLSADLSGKEASLEELTFSLTQHEEKWAKEQELLLGVNSDLEKAEGSKQLFLEKFSHITEKKQQLKKREEQIAGSIERHETEKKKVVQRLEEKTQEETVVQKKLITLQEGNVLSEKADRLFDITQEVQAQKEKMIELQSEQTYITQQDEDIKEKLHQLKKQQQKTKEEIQTLSSMEEEITEKIKSVEQEQKENEAVLQTWHTSFQQYTHTEKALLQEIQQAEQHGTKLRSQIDMLEDIEADNTGFFHGVKEILRARDRGLLQGVHGAVSQLMHVPKEYEVAIETALGSAAQHLVVENEKVGKQGILWLKEQRLGRATFLPLDVIQNRYISKSELSNVAKIAGFLGVASDLVSTEDQYTVVTRNLLGLIVISKSLKDATHIAQSLRHRYRVVTLDGDVMNPGGSMSGGSRQKAKTNLFGRPRQLEALKGELKNWKSLLEEKYQELQLVEEKKNKAHQEKVALNSRSEMLRVQLQELTSKNKELILHKQSHSALVNHVHTDYNELLDRQARITSRTEEIAREKDLLQASLAQLDQQREEMQTVLKKQEAQKEDTHEQITLLKVQVARLQQERVSLEENKERIITEIQQLILQIDEITFELMRLGEELNQNEVALQEVSKHIIEIRSKKEEIQSHLSSVRSERDRLIVNRETQTKLIQNQRTALRNQEVRLKEQEVRKNRLDVELQHFLQKLADDYEMSFERAKECYTVPTKVHETEKEINLIRQEIEALGEVHLGAIEEHERLTKRLSFLQKQEEDLLEAKKTLYDIIGQMETEMGNRFKESFEQIRCAFQEIFVQMFGGGRADLSFTDSTNLLETGIEIVAQPPGKRLTSLTLLSGGERALTAIVLLFAILKVKPVPFCVFDEVEAALDETNLDRFNRYLREFSGQTQFILISHRKRTMEAADVLYGVTMQESGVSQLVSVKLEDTHAYKEVAAGKAEE